MLIWFIWNYGKLAKNFSLLFWNNVSLSSSIIWFFCFFLHFHIIMNLNWLIWIWFTVNITSIPWHQSYCLRNHFSIRSWHLNLLIPRPLLFKIFIERSFLPLFNTTVWQHRHEQEHKCENQNDFKDIHFIKFLIALGWIHILIERNKIKL